MGELNAWTLDLSLHNPNLGNESQNVEDGHLTVFTPHWGILSYVG